MNANEIKKAAKLTGGEILLAAQNQDGDFIFLAILETMSVNYIVQSSCNSGSFHNRHVFDNLDHAKAEFISRLSATNLNN